MHLDPDTLTLLLCLQLLTLALSLSLMADWRGSPSLRWGVGGLWMQLLSWLCVAASAQVGVLASAASYLLGALSFSFILQALRGWLGPRPGLRLSWALPPLILLVYGLGHAFELPQLQRGATNLLMALNLGLLVLGLLCKAPEAQPGSRRWRHVLAFALFLLLGLTLWRGVTGLGFLAPYSSLSSGEPVALAVLLIGNLAILVTALAFLAAWRGEAEAQLRHAAQTDPLTGLPNRRALEERSARLIADTRRHGDTLLALLIDIDHFKQINDQHGHAQGDASLQLMGRLLLQLQRPGDCAARLGGEEFVLLMARSRADGARAFDQRLRTLLGQQAPEQLGFSLDYSAGWALLRPGDRHVHDLLARADAALYRAKAAGRGRLCAEPGVDADDAEDAEDDED